MLIQILMRNNKSFQIPNLINCGCLFSFWKSNLIYLPASKIENQCSYCFFIIHNFSLFYFCWLFIQTTSFISIHHLKYFFINFLISNLILLRFSFFFESMAQALNFNQIHFLILHQLFFHNFLSRSSPFFILKITYNMIIFS